MLNFTSSKINFDFTLFQVSFYPESKPHFVQSELEPGFIKTYEKHFTVEYPKYFQIVRDLIPGMKYRLTAKFIGNNGKPGPSSSLYIALSKLLCMVSTGRVTLFKGFRFFVCVKWHFLRLGFNYCLRTGLYHWYA